MTIPRLADVGTRVLTADERVNARWNAEIARANQGRHGHPLVLPSPMDAMPELLRRRALPAQAWPIEWPELARKCRTFPGDTNGVIGGTGSGKTQFGIQAARGFAAHGAGCVLWAPFELLPPELNLRVVANLERVHAMEIREAWPEGKIVGALASVTDRWRYVDTPDGSLETQVAAMEHAVDMATRIYGAPPLLVVDYIQRMAMGGEDVRAATTSAMHAIVKLVERQGCYGLVLSQTSRSNSPALAGRTEVESATDLVGVGAESSVIERDATNLIVLNVFKLDDTVQLDAHWLVGKARNTGLEGKVGARYHKAGGHWEELDHLPATPLEVTVEAKKAKRAGGEGGPSEAREALNAGRRETAANRRREAVVAALRAAGCEGLGARELRKAKGTGSAAKTRETLEELARAGRVRGDGGRWVFVV